MSSPFNLQRGSYAYVSDDGNTYQVGLAAINGTAGGFAASGIGENPAYPRGWQMRHVYGVDSGGHRTKIPCAAPDTAIFVSGGSVSKNSVSFVVEGKIGEKRMNKGT